MQVLDIKYLELIDLSHNKFYLLVRYEDNGHFLVTRRYGARGSTGLDKGKIPYSGTISYAAKAALDKLYYEKTSEGYKDVSPIPVALQNLVTSAAKGTWTGAAPVAKPAAPAAPRIPMISVPFPVGPRLLDDATLTMARADRSWSICRIPDKGQRVYCLIGSVGSGGRFAAPVLVGGQASSYEADVNTLTVRHALGLRSLGSPTPVLEDTTFDGFLEDAGPATKYALVDILFYRGADVRRFPLVRRAQLLEQAVAELAGDKQLPGNWRIAPIGPRAMIGERLLVRHLADKYEPGARWFAS
jgi:predicted DNA-binding WGR domain protein